MSNASGIEKKIRLQIWKFRSEHSCDRTHQFFFSSRAVYLILFNAVQPHTEATAEMWVQKIVSRVNKPRIIICATHIDHGHHVDREETNQRITNITEKFTNLFRDVVQSIDVIGVSSKTGENMRKLRMLVQMLVSMHKGFGEAVPGSTLLLESALREHVSQITTLASVPTVPITSRRTIVNFAKNCGIVPKDVPRSLDYLRDDCQIYFWSSNSPVILDSVWLASALSTLINGGYRYIFLKKKKSQKIPKSYGFLGGQCREFLTNEL